MNEQELLKKLSRRAIARIKTAAEEFGRSPVSRERLMGETVVIVARGKGDANRMEEATIRLLGWMLFDKRRQSNE